MDAERKALMFEHPPSGRVASETSGEGEVPDGFQLDISGKFTLPGRRLPIGQPRPTLPEGGC